MNYNVGTVYLALGLLDQFLDEIILYWKNSETTQTYWSERAFKCKEVIKQLRKEMDMEIKAND